MPVQTSPFLCGLDFGTSNSTAGLAEPARKGANSPARLAAVEDGKPTIPSAIFFSNEDGLTYFGRAAIAEYIDGAEGRLMRALKSVLGTSLINEKTRVRTRQMEFTEIIGLFLHELKRRAEEDAGCALDDVVMGRPVHFVDDDPLADREAQGQLESAARAQGFRHIAFQYEPIAAALDYESRIGHEEVALIVDIGGGTADFSIVRVSPQRARSVDRTDDILANAGVHIGGTDFDRLISMARVMPLLGYRTKTADGKRDLPSTYYFDLATWQRINWLYNPKVMHELREVRYEARFPALVERMMAVVEERQGHLLASRVEAAKIALTDSDTATISLQVRNELLEASLTRASLQEAIFDTTARITATVQHALHEARLRPDGIDALFLTGGSTQIPFVKASILALFPGARVVEGDMFGSVGLGLALDARRKFS